MFSRYEKLIERKTRKRWLVSFLLVSAIPAVFAISVFLVFCAVVVGGGLQIQESFSKEIGIPLGVLGVVISTFPFIAWFWITYHCSFKKRGTAWLSWTMVISLIRVLIVTMSIALIVTMGISKGDWSDIGELGALSWFFVTLFWGVEAYYLFNCYHLRKVNSNKEDG